MIPTAEHKAIIKGMYKQTAWSLGLMRKILVNRGSFMTKKDALGLIHEIDTLKYNLDAILNRRLGELIDFENE